MVKEQPASPDGRPKFLSTSTVVAWLVPLFSCVAFAAHVNEALIRGGEGGRI